jgi:hypothetical protein
LEVVIILSTCPHALASCEQFLNVIPLHCHIDIEWTAVNDFDVTHSDNHLSAAAANSTNVGRVPFSVMPKENTSNTLPLAERISTVCEPFHSKV